MVSWRLGRGGKGSASRLTSVVEPAEFVGVGVGGGFGRCRGRHRVRDDGKVWTQAPGDPMWDMEARDRTGGSPVNRDTFPYKMMRLLLTLRLDE